jgi:hypothetical protein
MVLGVRAAGLSGSQHHNLSHGHVTLQKLLMSSAQLGSLPVQLGWPAAALPNPC